MTFKPSFVTVRRVVLEIQEGHTVAMTTYVYLSHKIRKLERSSRTVKTIFRYPFLMTEYNTGNLNDIGSSLDSISGPCKCDSGLFTPYDQGSWHIQVESLPP
jgi:hypothetical protein